MLNKGCYTDTFTGLKINGALNRTTLSTLVICLNKKRKRWTEPSDRERERYKLNRHVEKGTTRGNVKGRVERK